MQKVVMLILFVYFLTIKSFLIFPLSKISKSWVFPFLGYVIALFMSMHNVENTTVIYF